MNGSKLQLGFVFQFRSEFEFEFKTISMTLLSVIESVRLGFCLWTFWASSWVLCRVLNWNLSSMWIIDSRAQNGGSTMRVDIEIMSESPDKEIGKDWEGDWDFGLVCEWNDSWGKLGRIMGILIVSGESMLNAMHFIWMDSDESWTAGCLCLEVRNWRILVFVHTHTHIKVWNLESRRYLATHFRICFDMRY
jgi:hypothetical protein